MTPLFLMLQLIFNSNELDDLISRVYAQTNFQKIRHISFFHATFKEQCIA